MGMFSICRSKPLLKVHILGMILNLGNKVVQKLKLEKNVFLQKKWSPKLIFLNEFFLT